MMVGKLGLGYRQKITGGKRAREIERIFTSSSSQVSSSEPSACCPIEALRITFILVLLTVGQQSITSHHLSNKIGNQAVDQQDSILYILEALSNMKTVMYIIIRRM